MTDVELVKSKIDIVEFIGGYIQLKKAGRNFKALCPFHGEKTPSFVVSPERQTWHCFGACAMGGDVVSFLEKWEGIEFLEALQDLARMTGVTLSKYAPTKSQEIKEKLYSINNLSSEFYNYILTSHKLGQRARDYLKSRNINDKIVSSFKLGYAPENWDNLNNFLKRKNISLEDMNLSGLVIRSDSGKYYDRFRGRLMFALKDHRGNIIGFSGRKLTTGNSEIKEAKYVNTPETEIYIKGNVLYGLDMTKDSIKKEKSAIVVEGEFDFLSSFQAGITNIVAIKGSALTENQTLLLKRYCENLILALDMDIAGNEAAKRGIEIAENSGLMVKVAELPFGKDPADCIQKSPGLWKEALKKAVPVYDFIINQAFRKHDRNEISGKRKITEEIIPFLGEIKNPIVFSHYTKKIAKDLGVDEQAIYSAIDQFAKRKVTKSRNDDIRKTKKTREELLEEHLLSLVLQSENPKNRTMQVLKILKSTDFNQPPVKTIFDNLEKYFVNNEKFDISNFSLMIVPEITDVFDRAYLVDVSAILRNDSACDKEIEKTAKEIRKLSIRRKINILTTKIKDAEESEDKEKAAVINREIKDLVSEINLLEK